MTDLPRREAAVLEIPHVQEHTDLAWENNPCNAAMGDAEKSFLFSTQGISFSLPRHCRGWQLHLRALWEAAADFKIFIIERFHCTWKPSCKRDLLNSPSAIWVLLLWGLICHITLHKKYFHTEFLILMFKSVEQLVGHHHQVMNFPHSWFILVAGHNPCTPSFHLCRRQAHFMLTFLTSAEQAEKSAA